MSTTNQAFLYPNVSRIPNRIDSELEVGKKPNAGPGEFDQALESAISKQESSRDLSQIKSPLKFSAHALQRLQDRKINLDAETMRRVDQAIDKAASKGVEDTLVIAGDAALIVSVKNRTIVTAMDKNSLNGNVFTNIDGAVIV